MIKDDEKNKLRVGKAYKKAIADGDFEQIKQILTSPEKHLVDVDDLTGNNLALVISKKYMKIAQFLISSPLLTEHANPFSNNGFSLSLANEIGEKDFVKQYLESQFYYSKGSNIIYKESETKTAEKNACNHLLLSCIRSGDVEMAEYLLRSPKIKVHANCNKDLYSVFVLIINYMINSNSMQSHDLILKQVLSKNNAHPINLAKHYPSIEITIFESLAFPQVSQAIISAFASTDNWPSIDRLYTYLHLNGRKHVLDALISPFREKMQLSSLVPQASESGLKIKI